VNFAEVLDIGAARAPEAEAIRLEDRSRTYAELRDRARRVASLLGAAGFAPDAKVAVLMHNALEYPEIAFGIMGSGCVLLPVNPRLTAAEVRYVLDNADVEGIFVGPEFTELLAEVEPKLERIARVYAVGPQPEAVTRAGWTPYDEALASASEGEWAATEDDADCMIVYTSGTTGHPKGAVRSHASAMWGAANFSSVWGDFSPESDSFLYCIPMASIGFLNVFASCLFNGLRVEIMYKFTAERALELMATRSLSHAYLVPAMWRMIIRSAALDTHDTTSLRVAVWGGEPLDDALRLAIIDRFGPVLLGVFGTTEGALLSSRPGDDARHPKTSGRAAGYNLFKIIDEEGRKVARGAVGELINKSPTTLTRYYKNPDATAEVLRDGWYHTGDLARMDDEGFVFVVDRKREMLIAGGQNVYPAELERVLTTHPGVAAAAVIGVPDADWGEASLAFVVSRGQAPAVDDLVAHMRSELAGYKVPRHWRFVDELPTNSMGKVRKHALREMWRAE
jgi:fatty-acyl-CoA synthase